MAVSKLRADAPPFTISHCRLRFPPPPPPHCMAVPVCSSHPAACSPPFTVVPSYPFAPILAPPPRPIYGFPPLPHPPAPVPVPVPFFGKVVPPPPQGKARVAFLRKRKVLHMPPPTLPAGTGAFLRKVDPSPPPAPLSAKDVPSPPPPPTKPALLRRETLPFGSPPHKLMLLLGGGVVAEKPAMARAAEAEPVNPGQEPAAAPAAGPRHGRRMAALRLLRRQQQPAERGRSGMEVGRPPVERACKRASRSRSQSPAFTTRPPSPIPAPEWRKRQVTTVMIRNIPNKLKPDEMMQLLDELCARANSKKKKKPVVAAYDFLYLPMDFSKHSNMGYAFVNLTTAEAARGLHYALHGARWKVHGTRKVIDIRAARIQGKDALVTHFSGSTFPCHTDDYLPAAFSPPRDGAAGPSTAARHVGNRVTPRLPARQPLPVERLDQASA